MNAWICDCGAVAQVSRLGQERSKVEYSNPNQTRTGVCSWMDCLINSAPDTFAGGGKIGDGK